MFAAICETLWIIMNDIYFIYTSGNRGTPVCEHQSWWFTSQSLPVAGPETDKCKK